MWRTAAVAGRALRKSPEVVQHAVLRLLERPAPCDAAVLSAHRLDENACVMCLMLAFHAMVRRMLS